MRYSCISLKRVSAKSQLFFYLKLSLFKNSAWHYQGNVCHHVYPGTVIEKKIIENYQIFFRNVKEIVRFMNHNSFSMII